MTGATGATAEPAAARRAATMRAAVCRRLGPPEVVTVEELPVPRPGPGEVLVRVKGESFLSTND